MNPGSIHDWPLLADTRTQSVRAVAGVPVSSRSWPERQSAPQTRSRAHRRHPAAARHPGRRACPQPGQPVVRRTVAGADHRSPRRAARPPSARCLGIPIDGAAGPGAAAVECAFAWRPAGDFVRPTSLNVVQSGGSGSASSRAFSSRRSIPWNNARGASTFSSRWPAAKEAASADCCRWRTGLV